MNGIKEIIFKYHTGYFNSMHLPNVDIKINEKHVTYQQVFDGWSEEERTKGPIWRSKTDLVLFDELIKMIPGIYYRPMPIVCDGDGTLVIVKDENGKKEEKYIPLSFYDCDLDFLVEPLVKLLQGLDIPPFLRRFEKDDEEELDDEEV